MFVSNDTDVLDPLIESEWHYDVVKAESVVLEPGAYLIARTKETFNIPNNVKALVIGKSTLARCGLMVNVTPVEPGFSGHVVIEIANTSKSKVRVHANMGIAQFIFFRLDQTPLLDYADLCGVYQGQQGVVNHKVPKV
jgi:dCTP deaminase